MTRKFAARSRRERRRLGGVMLGLLSAVPMILVAQAAPSSGSTSTTFAAVADATVDQNQAGANFGSRVVLRADTKPTKRAYLKFSVANLGGAIEKATLRVFSKDANASGFEVRSVPSTTWGEKTITFANAPTPGAVVGRSGATKAGAWSTVDVTSAVAGNGLVSLAVLGSNSSVIRFGSRESSNDPQLLVDVAGTTSTTQPTTTTTTSPPPAGGDPVLVAAGDIACDPADGNFNGGVGTAVNCRQLAVSDLILNMNPTAVAPLGDLQYDSGQLSQFNGSFDKSWGRFKAKIKPTVGNHEYKTDPKATGYYTYFGAAAGDPAKGYYSYDLGGWHVVVLNSNCGAVGGCGAGSAQEQWLRADLAAHPAPCTVAYWHHPRWSSGNHGSSPTTDAFWKALYDARADLVLNGHDHSYERFARQNPAGGADPAGIRQFTVGTGGKSHYALGTAVPNSEVRNDNSYGALKLTLHAGSYDWKFVPEPGKTFTDSGSQACS